MSVQYDVSSGFLSATGTLFAGPARVKGYQIAPGAAGNIVFRDGGTGGTVKMTVPLTASTNVVSLLIPGEGVRFNTDVHITLPASTSIAVFYG